MHGGPAPTALPASGRQPALILPGACDTIPPSGPYAGVPGAWAARTEVTSAPRIAYRRTWRTCWRPCRAGWRSGSGVGSFGGGPLGRRRCEVRGGAQFWVGPALQPSGRRCDVFLR